jgi:hypothetical protein
MATRQPTEQEVQVDSALARSHGRARKRKGSAVRAPTGQIWIVFPLKYDEKGSSGKVLTSVRLPRPMNEISGSPATSSAKRVQRSQRMHRSRSMRTSSLRAMGLA